MAGGQERVLRRRIKSVQATRKITKAMELIAASQIPKSQARIVANRPYRDGMRRVIVEAALADPAGAAKLLATPERVETCVVVAIVGDRGLSGAYNSSTLRATERLIRSLQAQGTQVRLFTVGKKAPSYFRFRGVEVEESFVGFADRPTFADARVVAAKVVAPYVDGEAQQVMLVSTRFASASSQFVDTTQLLPLTVPEMPVVEASTALKGYTEFEPEVEQLLAFLAPRALESEIFSALLEGAAAFHTSQQRAMAAATDNADELGQTLTRVMNRARQDSITTEIMEIVSGAEALRS
ncbi:MAG: ATP synthase F1 subunit gamma, partial [Acidobacteriota bacterium]|nr:ATP synthase F1 subunit gamma [Acidobacteriota bacterium]